MALKRRDFLKIGTGLTLSLPLYQCIPEDSYKTTSRSNWLAAVENWVPSICQACPGGCGILVRLIDDRAVKIEGNPLHPQNKGKVCSKGQAGLQLLYNPNRIQNPLKKTGDRAQANWRPISWDEALTEVSAKLLELRGSGLSHTVAFVGRDQNNTTDSLIERFLQVYGSPNFFKFDEWAAINEAYFETQGIKDLLALDMEKSRLILSFNAHFLSNWPNAMENQRTYGRKRAERSLKIIQIDPRFSIEASRADRWIPIHPGSEGLLALGLASILIKEKLYNRIFIDRFTSRFNEFKDFILQNVRLDMVSEQTGIPLRSIIEIAKEFASIQPAVAIPDYSLSFSDKGIFNVMAIHSLNALVGNIDSPGGFIRQRPAPLAEFPPVELDETAKKSIGVERHSGTLQHIFSKSPYGINCLFISNSGQGLFSPVSRRKPDLLENIPFIVSFSPVMDETTSLADIILPDTTYFEKWQDFRSSPLSKAPAVGISPPVVKPLYQSQPLESTLVMLAKSMGGAFEANFSWSSYKQLLLSRLKGLYQAQKGSIFSTPYEEAQLKILEERGWWIPQHDSEDAFIKDLQKKGGWQDPVYHFNERSFIYQTPSRRFVFPTSFKLSGGKGGDKRQLEYPLLLHLFDLPHTSGEVGSDSFPWYQENLGFRLGSMWKVWAELNPATAEELGIQNEDEIWIESSQTRIKAIAKVFPGIKPGLLAMPVNKTENPILSKEETEKNDPLLLLEDHFDTRTGIPDRTSTRVKIYKA